MSGSSGYIPGIGRYGYFEDLEDENNPIYLEDDILEKAKSLGYILDGNFINLYEKQENTFHISEGKDIICIKCGSKTFNVSKDSSGYLTFIRCAYCQWETCIHDG